MVQLGGLEPPTSGSTIRRSNQLSYNCTHGLAANSSEPFSGALPGACLAARPSSASPRTQLSYNCTHGLAAKQLSSPSPALSRGALGRAPVLGLLHSPRTQLSYNCT